MKFAYRELDNLPSLSWIADIKGNVATVIHGGRVEAREKFFVEGAWNGDFSSGNFDTSDWFCGTGGKIDGKACIFSTPSHVTSGLFTSANWGGVLVSNSLHLLCAYAGYHIDPQYLEYEADFNKILFGISNYKNEIYVMDKDDNPVDVKVHYFRNIRIGETGDIEITQKQKTRPFRSFEDYYDRLTKAIGGMMSNGQDDARNVIYDSVTTVSKGYDAPCCATIARKFGCNTAVTFTAKGKYIDDSGKDIAEILGYENIIERDADEYLNRNDLAEAEQICSGELGSDMCFITFDQDFKGKIVFTGDRGDSIWAYANPICNDEFRFSGGLSHLGNSERRLWVGYISCPMPLYGASSWVSIQRIAQSVEMKPWSVGNGYDRPIPRRICEEAGIKRQMFGVKKHGAGITLRYDWGQRAKSRMSRAAANSFSQYVRENKQPHFLQMINYFWKARKIYLSSIGIKLNDKTSITEKSQIANATVSRYLYPWASEMIQERYRSILKE